MIRLADDWKEVLRRAWSVRFLVLAILLSSLEVLLPFVPRLGFVISPLALALTSLVVTVAALLARIAAQKNLKG